MTDVLGPVENLLTDDFEEFTAKIKAIHDEKKAKTAELKAAYEKHKEEMMVLDQRAAGIYKSWQKGSNGKAETKPEPKKPEQSKPAAKTEKGGAATK